MPPTLPPTSFLHLSQRYRTMVRAVRLGYNVLSTDNDVMLFDDPYAYFKSPPFSDFTVGSKQRGQVISIAVSLTCGPMNAREDCLCPPFPLEWVVPSHPSERVVPSPLIGAEAARQLTCLLPPHRTQVLNQQEHWDSHNANGGFIYIQNAQANGPAVWLFTEVGPGC